MADADPDSAMWSCDERQLSEAADVGEVLEWARATATPEQTFTVYVEHRHGDSPGLTQLFGTDPRTATGGADARDQEDVGVCVDLWP